MLGFLIDLFAALWRSDDRPGARKFTIGCVLIVAALMLIVAYLASKSGD